MSISGLENVFTRWSQDADFRDRFKASPQAAVRQEGIDLSDDEWTRIWNVNLMAHVYAARAVLPGMIARGDGYLMNTATVSEKPRTSPRTL